MKSECSCGGDCPICNVCGVPKCECFCDLYDEYEEGSDEEGDDENDDDE